jgi:hypothetical protein
MVLATWNPSTWEAEAGGFNVQSQTELYSERLVGLHSKTLSQKNKTKYSTDLSRLCGFSVPLSCIAVSLCLKL